MSPLLKVEGPKKFMFNPNFIFTRRSKNKTLLRPSLRKVCNMYFRCVLHICHIKLHICKKYVFGFTYVLYICNMFATFEYINKEYMNLVRKSNGSNDIQNFKEKFFVKYLWKYVYLIEDGYS